MSNPDEDRIEAALLRLDKAKRAQSSDSAEEYTAARLEYAAALNAVGRAVPQEATDPLGTGTE
jgi:hypothetical protein